MHFPENVVKYFSYYFFGEFSANMTAKKYSALLLILLLAAGLWTVPPVRADKENTVTRISVTVAGMHCGDEITEEGPEPELAVQVYYDTRELEDAVEIVKNTWASEYRRENLVPFTGVMEGDESYTVYLELRLLQGLVLDEEPVFSCTDGTQWIEPVTLAGDRAVLAVHVRAEHINNHDPSEELNEATCISTGLDTYICAHCGRMIISFLPIDPDGHAWGEWTVLKEATNTETGEKTHTCSLCGEEEKVEIPRKHTDIFEPETSFAMSTAVAWRADGSLARAADSERRPAVVFLWVDAVLNVYDRDGGLLTKGIDSFMKKISPKMIPAFCFRDEAEAKALRSWLESAEIEECFVVSSPENLELVRHLSELPNVRAILDCEALEEADEAALAEMALAVNEAGGTTVLLNKETATRENIRLLQGLLVSVWVQAPSDPKTLLTLLTNGVDGLAADDYEMALRTVETFRSDAPAILRMPRINDVLEDCALRAAITDEQFEAYRDRLEGLLTDWEESFITDPPLEAEELAREARNRGMVLLPEHYRPEKDAESFARAFLAGIQAMKLEDAEMLSMQVTEIFSEDLVRTPGKELPKPQGKTRGGELTTLDRAELVEAGKNADGTELMMWRLREELTLNGESHGYYDLYSAPFSVKTEAEPTEASAKPTAESSGETPTEPEDSEKAVPPAVILLWILLGLAAAALLGAITVIVVKMVKKQKE